MPLCYFARKLKKSKKKLALLAVWRMIEILNIMENKKYTKEWIERIVSLKNINQNEKVLYLAVSLFDQGSNLSAAKMSELTGIKTCSVNSGLRKLQEKGLLHRDIRIGKTEYFLEEIQ